MGFKATLSATSVRKSPRTGVPSILKVQLRVQAARPVLGSPWPPPSLCKPNPGHVQSGFTYLPDQPIFLSEAFANSWGAISYSRLVKIFNNGETLKALIMAHINFSPLSAGFENGTSPRDQCKPPWALHQAFLATVTLTLMCSYLTFIQSIHTFGPLQ